MELLDNLNYEIHTSMSEESILAELENMVVTRKFLTKRAIQTSDFELIPIFAKDYSTRSTEFAILKGKISEENGNRVIRIAVTCSMKMKLFMMVVFVLGTGWLLTNADAGFWQNILGILVDVCIGGLAIYDFIKMSQKSKKIMVERFKD